jgi:hypothetical protein
MYARRRYCCNETALQARRGPIVDCAIAVCHTRTPDVPAAIPESIRLRNRVECLTYVRTNSSLNTCQTTEGSTPKAPTTSNTQPTYTNAPVTVRTTPASATAALKAVTTLQAATNPSNPDTRFEQYFRPRIAAPLAVVCPERIPNNEPTAPNPVRNCVPNSRYQSSAEQAAAAAGGGT